ncbi:MAG: glycosyltransferase [Oscillospiraceae bacterium]|nr:glycosyltransferase [Oscillospiraceae bacterium]
MRLSIIIPVYNVEPYLDACMESLLPQMENKPVEVLLLDDGSTDGSAALAKKWEEKSEQVRFFCHENGGASYTRNVGMGLARGEYIQFVDSDDWLEEGAIDEILAALEAGPDLLLLNVNRYREGKLESCTGWDSNDLAQGNEAFISRLISEKPVHNMVVTAMVRRRWQQEKELTYLEGIVHEDMEWVPHLICEAEKIAILDKPVYAYRLARQGSVMNATRLEHRCESLMLVARTLMGRAESGYDPVRREFSRRAAGLCLFMAMGYAADMGPEKAKAMEKDIRKDLLLGPAAKAVPRKYRLCCLLGGGLAGGIKLYRKL